MASDDYLFIQETPLEGGHTLLRWDKRGEPHDPLNFWHVPRHIPIDLAKERVRSGELDCG